MKYDCIDSCSVIRSCDLPVMSVIEYCEHFHMLFLSAGSTQRVLHNMYEVLNVFFSCSSLFSSVLFISDHWVLVIFRLSREKKLVVLYRNAGYEPFFPLLHRIVSQALFKNTKLVPDPMHMCRKWKCKWNPCDVDRCCRSVCSGAVDHGSSW